MNRGMKLGGRDDINASKDTLPANPADTAITAAAAEEVFPLVLPVELPDDRELLTSCGLFTALIYASIAALPNTGMNDGAWTRVSAAGRVRRALYTRVRECWRSRRRSRRASRAV
jgi:hypothetical protein